MNVGCGKSESLSSQCSSDLHEGPSDFQESNDKMVPIQENTQKIFSKPKIKVSENSTIDISKGLHVTCAGRNLFHKPFVSVQC